MQLARLVHLGDDVAAPNELAVDEQLRDRGPVGEARELLTDPWVRQYVDRCKGLTERLKHGDGTSGEPAGGLLRRPLHEQDHGVLGDRALDRLAHRIGCHIAHWITSSEAFV